jgi:type II secretory pathway pseudopilin PulG
MKKYATIRNYAKRYHKQAGMTLIELTVVLLILIGLAGLLIPYVGSFIQKTHDSTNSSNLAQLNSAFIRYVAENNRLPQHMDSLTNASGVSGTGVCSGTQTAADIYCGLLDKTVFATATYTKPATSTLESAYSSAEIAYKSLDKAKISMWVNNNTQAPNKTFGSSTGMVMISTTSMMATSPANLIKVAPVSAATSTALSVGTAVEDHVALALGKDPMDYNASCYDYVTFGLGDANGLVTKTIAQAPVHFPEDATKGPVEYYNHYMAVIQVDKNNGAGTSYSGSAMTCSSVTEPAKFLGVVMNTPAYPGSHLFGANASLAYGYQNQLEGK